MDESEITQIRMGTFNLRQIVTKRQLNEKRQYTVVRDLSFTR
jgi:hypothetical protein